MMLLPHTYVQGVKVLSSIVVIVMNTLSNLAVLAPSEIICKCNKSVNFFYLHWHGLQASQTPVVYFLLAIVAMPIDPYSPLHSAYYAYCAQLA